MPTLQIEKLLKSLASEKVKFVLVGGIAAIGHGMNYVTTDIDICYERSDENIKVLVKALKPIQPKLRTKEGSVPFLFDFETIKKGLNFTLDTEWGPIDLIAELSKLGGYPELIKNAETIEFYGVPTPIISLNDLIKAKEATGRPKDEGHLMELKAIREIKRK